MSKEQIHHKGQSSPNRETEPLISTRHDEEGRLEINISPKVIKIGAVVVGVLLALEGIGHHNHQVHEREKNKIENLPPAAQVVQVIRDYNDGTIENLPDDTILTTVTLEEGDNPTSVAREILKKHEEHNPADRYADRNETEATILETGRDAQKNWQEKNGGAVQPGDEITVATGDINGDGKLSVGVVSLDRNDK